MSDGVSAVSGDSIINGSKCHAECLIVRVPCVVHVYHAGVRANTPIYGWYGGMDGIGIRVPTMCLSFKCGDSRCERVNQDDQVIANPIDSEVFFPTR